jgi:site-specific recombinase XerD
MNVEHRQPSTVNRHLAALRRFFQWAKASGLVKELPTENVKGVASVPRSPHWLEKRDVDRLIRTVERHGNTRDLAIVLTLRHSGIRVSELCALMVGDVEISERRGTLTVRSGKGSKFRILPLNVDARQTITGYLKVRPTVSADHLFIGQRGQGISSRAVCVRYSGLAHFDAREWPTCDGVTTFPTLNEASGWGRRHASEEGHGGVVRGDPAGV